MSIEPTKGDSIAEAARLINRHRNSVRNYINSGVLKAYEGRRKIKGDQKALLIKGKELIAYLNTY